MLCEELHVKLISILRLCVRTQRKTTIRKWPIDKLVLNMLFKQWYQRNMELENEDGGEDKMNGSRSTGLVIIYVFVRETVIYTSRKTERDHDST